MSSKGREDVQQMLARPNQQGTTVSGQLCNRQTERTENSNNIMKKSTWKPLQVCDSEASQKPMILHHNVILHNILNKNWYMLHLYFVSNKAHNDHSGINYTDRIPVHKTTYSVNGDSIPSRTDSTSSFSILSATLEKPAARTTHDTSETTSAPPKPDDSGGKVQAQKWRWSCRNTRMLSCWHSWAQCSM